MTAYLNLRKVIVNHIQKYAAETITSSVTIHKQMNFSTITVTVLFVAYLKSN